MKQKFQKIRSDVRISIVCIILLLCVLTGVSHLTSSGVLNSLSPVYPKRSETEYTALLMRRANKGDATSQAVVARRYVRGDSGADKDWGEAVKWYRKIADVGFSDGALCIGELYRLGGPNLPQNWQETYFWFSVAANNPIHDPNAPFQRDDAAKHLTPEEIADVQMRARKWKPLAVPRSVIKEGNSGNAILNSPPR